MIPVRNYTPADATRLGQIMFDAIHAGTSAYTPAQRRAWLSKPNAGPDWAARLAAQQVWVAHAPVGPAGFISLGDDGYVDMVFVVAKAQGRGVFRALYRVLEAAATKDGCTRLWTNASLMAQPAFEACGFRVIRHEAVERSGEVLARAEMEKNLT